MAKTLTATERWLLALLLAGSGAWYLGRLLNEKGLVASLLFYIPAPLSGLALVLASYLSRHRRASCALLAAAASLPLLAAVREQNWTRPPATAAEPGPMLSVLHWNICSGYGGWNRLAREIKQGSPELVILSEVKKPEQATAALAALSEFPHHQLSRSLLVLSRYPLEPAELLYFGKGIFVYQLQLEREQEVWRFFVLDVAADPNVAREPAMVELRRLMLAQNPDFVAGDFNTPRNSRLFHPLASGWSHAYDRAGRGWSYTWPTYLPMLGLDHLFVRDATVAVRSYEIGTSWWSDHRLQRASLQHRQ